MTLYEISIIASALFVLGALRFGLPMLIMWLVNVVNHRVVHA